MRIGVISDTHGSFTAWQKVSEGLFKDVDLALHAGDVLYHGPRNPLPDGYDPMKLAEAINNWQTPLLIAQGNCDSEVDQMVIDLPIQAPYVYVKTELGTILVTHGHRYNQEQSIELANKYKIDIWISGHTHVPLIEKIEDTVFINPGSASLPKGAELHESVWVITKTDIKLYDLNTNEVYKSMERN